MVTKQDEILYQMKLLEVISFSCMQRVNMIGEEMYLPINHNERHIFSGHWLMLIAVEIK